MRARLHLLSVLLLLTVTGCAGTSTDSTSPAGVATQFDDAVSGGNFSQACALLTPATRSNLMEEERAACPTALQHSRVTPGGRPIDTRTYGRAALVTTSTTSTFLARTGATWQIRATGCTPKDDAPFDCAVGGH